MFQGVQTAIGLDPAHAGRRPALAFGLDQPRRHAHFGPGAPVDAQGRQPLPAPMMGQGVEEGIGRRVVALARRTQQGGRRGEQHEPIQPLGLASARANARRPALWRPSRDRTARASARGARRRPARRPGGRCRAAAASSPRMSDNSPATASRLPTSQRRTATRTPAFSNSSSCVCACGEAPDLPTRTRWRAPRSASQWATFRPKPPRPPVTRYVASSRSDTPPVGRVAVGGGPNHHFADVFGPPHVPQGVDGALRCETPAAATDRVVFSTNCGITSPSSWPTPAGSSAII